MPRTVYPSPIPVPDGGVGGLPASRGWLDWLGGFSNAPFPGGPSPLNIPRDQRSYGGGIINWGAQDPTIGTEDNPLRLKKKGPVRTPKSDERMLTEEQQAAERARIEAEAAAAEEEAYKKRMDETMKRYQDELAMREQILGKREYEPYPMPDKAQEAARMRNQAMLQVFAGMMEGAGGDFAPIGRGFARAGVPYEEGFERYQEALMGKAKYNQAINEQEYSDRKAGVDAISEIMQAEKEQALKLREKMDARKEAAMSKLFEIYKIEDPDSRNQAISAYNEIYGANIPVGTIDVTK